MNYADFKMKVKSILPFNRKERFFTGTVFPQLILHNGVDTLYEFLRQIKGFPSNLTSSDLENNFLLYTEYNLKESDIGNIFNALTGETPDVLIEIFEPKILIVIEAKMFQNLTQSELDKQIIAQKVNVSDLISSNIKHSAIKILHVALIPKQLSQKFDKKNDYSIINWDFFIDNCSVNVSDNHFYNYLKYALENYDKLVQKGRATTVKGYKTGIEIFNDGKNTGIWIGRNGGSEQIKEDIANGRWKNFEYSTNTEKPARGREGNWIPANKFIDLVNDYKNKKY